MVSAATPQQGPPAGRGPWRRDDLTDVVLLAGPAQAYRDAVHDDFKLVLLEGHGGTVRRRDAEYPVPPGRLVDPPVLPDPGPAHRYVELLTMVKNDRIFSEASLAWVDAIVWAIAAAWVVLVGVLLYVGFTSDDPGLPLLLFLMSIGVAVLGLLMVVMRALLRQATTLRTDMEAVI